MLNEASIDGNSMPASLSDKYPTSMHTSVREVDVQCFPAAPGVEADKATLASCRGGLRREQGYTSN